MAKAATSIRLLLIPPPDASSLCPPPPPPPPPVPSATVHFGHSYLIPALPIAAAFILALSALSIFVAITILRRRRRRAATALEDPIPFEDHGDEGEVDHHVWYIRTPGLDESTIASITAWAYKADDGVLGASPADCAVCLSEFRDGELLRLLPKCGHAFHVSCIDTWLRSHVNCPICRAPVVAQTSAASSADPGTTSSSFSSASSSPDISLDHVQPHLISSDQVDANQIDVRLPQTRHGNLEVEMARGRFEPGVGILATINQDRDSELRVPRQVGEQGLQPIRRSISLSSFIPAPSLNRSRLQEGISDSTKAIFLGVEWIDRTSRKQVSASNETTYLQKETERTSSSASGRFFLPRHRRAGSSVLPL